MCSSPGKNNKIYRSILEGIFVLDLADESGKNIKAAGNPVRFDGGNLTAHRFPPPLGGDSVEILKGVLGKSEEEVAALIDAAVVFKQRNTHAADEEG